MTTMGKQREQILVVDDDLDSRLAIADVLRVAGHMVEIAANGFEGLQLASRRWPDLVLTDLQMPGLNGIEFIRRLHLFAPAVPVVLATGIQDTKDLLTAAAAYGAVACLRKPMNVDDLLWTIDGALIAARQREASRRSSNGRPLSRPAYVR
jgi:CheY-like chemotaxis protein